MCFPARVRQDIDDVCALKVVMYWCFWVVDDGCFDDANDEIDAKLCSDDNEEDSG